MFKLFKSRRNVLQFLAATTLMRNAESAQNETEFVDAQLLPDLFSNPKVQNSIEKTTGVGREIESFLDANHATDREDCSDGFVKAVNWSAVTGLPVHFKNQYRLMQCVKIDTPNCTLVFHEATILLDDNPIPVQTKFGEKLKLGFLVSANNIALLGSAELHGLGVAGETLLQGMYFEELENLEVGSFTLYNMAIGLHFMCCDNVRCGDTQAESMWGLQSYTGGLAGAGSAQVVSGCRNSEFGRLTSFNNDKPARYLSVGKHSRFGPRDNSSNKFGFVHVTGRRGSPWAQATGIRSSVNSQFAGGFGAGVSFVFLCQKYLTDDQFNIDGNEFGSWSGQILDTAGSVDAGAYFWSEPNAKPIGRNHISKLTVSTEDQEVEILKKLGIKSSSTFGLYCSSGVLKIDEATFNGSAIHIYALDCLLEIDQFSSTNSGVTALQYGRGVTAHIGAMKIHSSERMTGKQRVEIVTVDAGQSRQPPVVSINKFACNGIDNRQQLQTLVKDDHFGNRTLFVSKFFE
jgi:hypothetical protein